MEIDISARLAERSRQIYDLRRRHARKHRRQLAEARANGTLIALTPAGRFDKKQLIRERFGVPILEFEGEMANAASIDKEELLARADALIERLESKASSARCSASRHSRDLPVIP